MSTAAAPSTSPKPPPATSPVREVTVYAHSPIFYWWPVWAFGYILALVTYLRGVPTTFAGREVLIHPSHNLGVTFTFVFLLVIVMTHFAVRGVASLTVIVSLIAVTLFLAYMDWWDPILRALGNLAIFMNLGFYMFFSTALFVVWALGVFVFDRFKYWTFRPGQMVHGAVFGAGEQAFDTHGMTVEKMRDDLFRHWILGLGSGDLMVVTTGAKRSEFLINNVLFVGTKLERIQQLVSMKPDQANEAPVTVGEPV